MNFVFVKCDKIIISIISILISPQNQYKCPLENNHRRRYILLSLTFKSVVVCVFMLMKMTYFLIRGDITNSTLFM